MKIVTLLLLILSCPALAAAQDEDAASGTRIAAVQISGIDDERLSPGLRRDINALVGQPLDLQILAMLAERIEGERPSVTTSFRALKTPAGDARVVFFVARIDSGHRRDHDFDVHDNVNSQYLIEKVVIAGVPESTISQTLRDELQQLTGTTLEHAQARRLEQRLRQELDGYKIDHKISRGSERGRIVLTFEMRKGEALRWVRFVPTRSKFLFHEDEGWSGLLDIPISGSNVRVTPRFAFDNGDDLLEEYSGGGVRIETRMVGSERLGIAFEAAKYDADWKNPTLAALAANPRLPALYDERTTVAPWVTFALTRRLRASGGISVTGLEPEILFDHSQTAGLVTGAISYDQRWPDGDRGHAVETAFLIGTTSEALGSDYDYTRVLWTGSYRYRWQEYTTVIASGMAGHISGSAPLFERFSLGDSTTLRGWNKYEVAPAGGDSMYHVSGEYRYRGLAIFTDVGSVWDQDLQSRVRVSTGFGLHVDNFFATYAFPLNAASVGGTFMIGVRF
jgi:hypothetical protein